MRALTYSLTEAGASVWRGRRAATIAVATIAVGLFLLGFFLLVNTNLERLVGRWTQAAEMSVFLADDVSIEARGTIEATLATSPLVERYEFVSKSEAMVRFRRDFADLAGLATELDGNPLPAAYEVQLRAGADTETALTSLADEMVASEGVVDVRYDRLWIRRLLMAVALLRGVSLAIIAIVGVAAALTVANVVRLAAYARLDEIEIMQLVGSPAAYVRGPFVAEGVIQGGLGSIVALLFLGAGYLAATARYEDVIAGTLGLEGLAFFSPWLITALLMGGTAVGCVGGMIAARSVR